MTLAEHFSTIEEQLETKNVVTFKWLSRKCKIHSTVAKQVLKEFADASEKNKYCVTYVVFCKDTNGNLVINLTDRSDLNNAANESSVIDTQIYSIENSTLDVTTDLLYNEEKLSFQLGQMELSSISYPSEVSKNPNLRRQTSSVANHEKNNADTSENPTTSGRRVGPEKEKGNKLNFPALPKSKSEEKTDSKSKQKTDTKSEDKSPKKLLFKTETESKVKNTETSKASTFKGSLSVLFQNHRIKSRSTSSTSAVNEDEESEGKKENSEKKEKTTSELVEEKQTEKGQSVKQSSPLEIIKNQAKTAKKSTVKSKKKPAKKKLKRVTATFESSSDELDNDENSCDKESPFDKMEEELEPEPVSEQPTELEPVICVVQGQKRKRKVISKSVMGEDGFFYTEREVVYESCDSDDNDENNPNVNQESTNKRLKISETDSNTNTVSKFKTASSTAEKTTNKNQKTKTKQASIMNFFKKS